MDPATMMMLAKGVSGGVPALAQAGLGIWQGIQGKKMSANLVDPIYDIPDSAEEDLQRARLNAGSRMMSGQAQAQQMIDQKYANTSSDIMKAAGSSTDALGALVQANAGVMGAQNNLTMEAARDYSNRQSDLSMALSKMAGYEDKKFQIDVIDKFNRDAAAASAMKNAAINNVFGGVKGLANTAGDAMSMKSQSDSVDLSSGLMSGNEESTLSKSELNSIMSGMGSMGGIAANSAKSAESFSQEQMLQMLKEWQNKGGSKYD